MPAMGAVTEGSCSVKVEIVERCSINMEPLRAWSNNTVRACIVQSGLGVVRFTDYESTYNLSVALLVDETGVGELHASKNVIGSLKVVELDGTSSLSDRAVSLVLV